MSGRENLEIPRTVDSPPEGKPGDQGALAPEHQTAGQSARDNQRKTEALVDKGFLPPVDLTGFPTSFRTGKELNGQELRDAGIKCKRDVDKDGARNTTVEYPNGIKVTVSEGHTENGPHGTRVEIGSSALIEFSPPNKIKPNGDVIDASGREIARQNPDGSVTVDTGKGFYTQYPDGIRKEAAIRSRDGKTFSVIDVDTPLGDLRPSDMSQRQ